MLWFRMAVPREYQRVAGTKKIQRSLKTRDMREAVLRAGGLRASLVKGWAASIDQRGTNPASHEELLELANLAGEMKAKRYLKIFNARRQESQEAGASALDRIENFRERILHENLSSLSVLAENLLKARGFLANDAAVTDLTEILRFVVPDHLRITLDHARGNFQAKLAHPVALEAQQIAARKTTSSGTILDHFEKYAQRQRIRGKKKDEGIKQDRMVVKLFAEIVGVDRSVESLSKQDARRFRDIIAKLPAGKNKKPELKNLAISEAIELSQSNSLPLLSPVTQQRYLSALSPLFDELVSEGTIETQIFDGLHINPQRGANSRPPFKTEQLNKILSSPLFSGFASDRALSKPGEQRSDDARKWIPLLCMFTGSRISEIAQLHVDNFCQIDGIWLALIAHDQERQQSVKNKKQRLIALHEKLIEAGFLNYLNRQISRAASDGNTMLFPELKLGSNGTWGEKPAKDWRRYLSSIGIKNGADGLGAHSFRHLMADEMRRAGYLDEEFGNLILGHGNKSITALYGQVTQGTAARLKKMIDSAKFLGVDFSSILPATQTS